MREATGAIFYCLSTLRFETYNFMLLHVSRVVDKSRECIMELSKSKSFPVFNVMILTVISNRRQMLLKIESVS